MEQSSLIEASESDHVLEENFFPSGRKWGLKPRIAVATSFPVMLGILVLTSKSGPMVVFEGDSVLKIESKAAKVDTPEKLFMANWKGATDVMMEITHDLKANIDQVNKDAATARKEIIDWIRAADNLHDKELRNQTETFVRAHVDLVQMESDFKSWLWTQRALFDVQVRMIKRKVKKESTFIDLTSEQKVLDAAVNKGLVRLGEMQNKASNCQVKFTQTAATAKLMAEEVQRKADKAEEELTRSVKKHQAQVEAGRAKAITATAVCSVGLAVVIGATAFITAGVSLIFAGIGAAACALGSAFLIDPHNPIDELEKLKNQVLKTFKAQKKSLLLLADKAKKFLRRAKRDYQVMNDVKARFDTVQALNLVEADFDYAKNVLLPGLQTLTKFLHDTANKIHVKKIE